MKKVFIAMITIALLLLPLLVYAQSAQSSKEAPPVSQALVPEGDFALKLVPALGLGTPNSEAQAEDMLTSVGIAPKNGWIADYPITPIVIGELQDAVAGASDAKKLPIEKVEALKAFHDLTTDFGLSVLPGGSGEYAENRPQPDSTMIDNYYYEEGPPIVTYYPPPWDYYYLYDWVPYPFWWGGFSFTGFFSLRDFHRFVIFGHHRHLISNHFIDPRTHAVTRVDPVSHSSTRFAHTTAFDSKSTRNAASSIFNHSVSSRGSRTFSNSNGSVIGSGMNHRSSQSFGRSFSAPSSSGSLSCANCHGSSGSFARSGGGSRAGSISSSHSSGGFSDGHSSGGFSGGHSSGGFSGGGFSGGHGGGGRGR
jgi:hypothetical protein